MKKQIVSMKRGAQKGFTLIELMIVVAIIGILAAFAVPMFQDYTVRTRVAEGLVLASSAKNLVVDNAVNGLAFKNGEPTFNATVNTESISIDAGTGAISIVATGKGKDIGLLLTPTDDGGALVAGQVPTGRIEWTCTVEVAGDNDNQIPPECRA